MSVGEALRSSIIWRIFVASFLLFFFGIGIVIHQVPILTEVGVSRANAAMLASLTGAAGIAGKLVTGYLLDRRDDGDIGAITLMASALGFVSLLEPFRTPATIVLAMAILGYAAGGKLQISSYLTSRYAGLRNFGKIFGVIVAGLSCGASLGTIAAGAVHDLFGSYLPIVIAGIPGSFFSGLLIYRLGRYPDWDAVDECAQATALESEPRPALT
jgi:MFS family permease